MATILLERQGLDDADPIARWEDGEWIAGDEGKYRLMRDKVLERYDEDMMLDEFNGPDIFATTEDAYQGDIDEELPTETKSAGVDISGPMSKSTRTATLSAEGRSCPSVLYPLPTSRKRRKNTKSEMWTARSSVYDATSY